MLRSNRVKPTITVTAIEAITTIEAIAAVAIEAVTE